MYPRKFAFVGGVVMLVMGVLSLVPALQGSSENLPPLALDTSYGLFLGFFPMNVVNKLALIILGSAGVMAANAKFTSLPLSIHFSRVVFVAMAILGVLGLFSRTNTFFGYWPLYGGEVLFHGVFALLGAYYGYSLSAKVPSQNQSSKDFRTPAHGLR